MALPVAPPPKPKDVAVLGWAGLTVRVAWTLLIQGVKVRPEVLAEARAHVLYHLDPATPQPRAEDLAAHLTEEFVARARGKAHADPWPQDWDMPLSPRWKRAVERSMDPLAEAVFRKHYGDNHSLERLASSLRADLLALEGARAGLREVVRRIAVADGLPIEEWPPPRIDRLLRRLAAWSPGPCPPVLDVVEGCHREHVTGCVRCDRLVRLVQTSVIGVDDLFAPTVGARPSGSARVLVLQVHTDARRHRKALLAELPVSAFPIGDDLVLLDGDDLDEVATVLRVAAEVGAPESSQLRGALLEGPGAWSPRGLLGPLPERAGREVLHRSWGLVDGVGELPAVLPEPPSARGWWAAVGVLAALGLAMLRVALFAPASSAPSDVWAEFTPGRGGVWVSFDVPEEALVTLVALEGGHLRAELASVDAADKAELALGDGSYRLHVPGDGALLLSHAASLDDLDRLLRASEADEDPLQGLASRLAGRAEARWGER